MNNVGLIDLKKYINFLLIGLPSWSLSFTVIYFLNDTIPFWMIAFIFHLITIHLNYFLARIFVFNSNERGSKYLPFLKYVALFRVLEYLVGLTLFQIKPNTYFALLIANGVISIVKFKILNNKVI